MNNLIPWTLFAVVQTIFETAFRSPSDDICNHILGDKTGIPMMLDLISVSTKGSRPISSLDFPSKVGSINIFSVSSNFAAFLS